MIRIILHFCLFLKHKSDVWWFRFAKNTLRCNLQIICKIFHRLFIILIASVLDIKDEFISLNGNTYGNRCFRCIQLNRFFRSKLAADRIELKAVSLINNHCIRFYIKFTAYLWERINIIIHRIDKLLLNACQTLFCTAWKIAVNRKCFYKHTYCFWKSWVISSMIDRRKHSIFSEIIFSKRKSKNRNEKYIFRNLILLTEILYTLHRYPWYLFTVSFRRRNWTIFVRVEAYTSSGVLKYWFIVILSILINITLKRISVIKRKIIRSILLCLKFFSGICSVNIIDYDSERCAVCNDMVNIQEQIIYIAGSVNLKSEKLFVK